MWEILGRRSRGRSPAERAHNPAQPPTCEAGGLKNEEIPKATDRDARQLHLFEGTSEIQRLVIARTVAGVPIR